MKEAKTNKKPRLTVLQVAKEMNISDRRIITRAGRLSIERMRQDGLGGTIKSESQIESWNGRSKIYNVATYKPAFKSIIQQMLNASEIIQKQIDSK